MEPISFEFTILKRKIKINDETGKRKKSQAVTVFTGEGSHLHRDSLSCVQVSELKSVLFMLLCGGLLFWH